MAEQRDVKVFVSWSGDLAKAVAVALREWLPLLFDRVSPFVSDKDIDAGERGLAKIESELKGTQFGIVVVTAANQDAPWLNFEAGAMSKTITDDFENRVVPLLVDLSGPTQLTGPLGQFQAKRADRGGVLELLRSLAAVAGIDERVVEQRFERYWLDLEASIATALQAAAAEGQPAVPERDAGDLLEEILIHVRALRSMSESPAPPANEGRGLTASVMNFLTELAAQYDLTVWDADMDYHGVIAVTVRPSDGTEITDKNVLSFERDLRRGIRNKVAIKFEPF